jgi:protein-disulfide isomerase
MTRAATDRHSRHEGFMLARLAALMFSVLALLSVARAEDNAYPINGEDGTPVLNHKVPEDALAVLQKLPRAVIIGDPNGDVTLVEFYDLNCPFCRKASVDVRELMAQDKKLKVVLVPFPVLGIPSIQAGRVEFALAGMVTPQQFYVFHQKIFGGRGVVDGERALAVAAELGLDPAKLTKAANEDSIVAAMKAHVGAGDALDLQATPSFVIGDIAIVGYPGRAELEKAVKSARACGKAAC